MDHTATLMESMALQFSHLGVRRGGALLVHASLSSLGLPKDRDVPEAVIRALLSALGEDGVLLFPALSYEYANAAHPFFDVRNTPSNVGFLPEYFRIHFAQQRSVCPTHSVCGCTTRGRDLLDFLLSGHASDTTPGGPHSPYRRLYEAGGQILFLGCGINCNTSMHAVEELSCPPYLFGDEIVYDVTLADGTHTVQTLQSHNFSGYKQRYDRLSAILDKRDLNRGYVLAAECFLMEAKALWCKASAILEKDPFAFVERQPPFFPHFVQPR